MPKDQGIDGKCSIQADSEDQAEMIRKSLPKDVTYIRTHVDGLSGVCYVIVSGPRLPPQAPRAAPWSFQSVAAMNSYREGNHIS